MPQYVWSLYTYLSGERALYYNNYTKYHRSHVFDPEKKDFGGKNFILFAIMTDVENDIFLGSDGVEHL